MRRTIVFILAVLMTVFMVSAGHISIDDPEFEDGSHDYDGDAEIDADTVQGLSGYYIWHKLQTDDIADNVMAGRVYGAEHDIDDINNHIAVNEDDWSKDNVGGGGMSRNDLGYFLTGIQNLFNDFDTFMDYLYGIFALKSEIRELNDRLDRLETLLILSGVTDDAWDAIDESGVDFDKIVAEMNSMRRNECASVGNYTCCPNGVCVMTR